MHRLRVYPRISAAPARGEAAGPEEMSDNPIKVSSARRHCLSACFSSSLAGQAPAALPGGVFGAGRWRRSFPRSTGEGFCTVAAEAEDNGQRSDGRVKRDLFRCQGQKDLPRSCSRQKGAHEGRRGEGRAGDGAGSARRWVCRAPRPAKDTSPSCPKHQHQAVVGLSPRSPRLNPAHGAQEKPSPLQHNPSGQRWKTQRQTRQKNREIWRGAEN